MDKENKYAWIKLNSYGVILAGLCILSVTDLINPANTDISTLVGTVPPGQFFWVVGFVISGLAIMYGFIVNDRLAETLGLILLASALMLQTAVALILLGFGNDFVITRFIILGLIGLAGGARISVLWSKEGVVITIPPRRVQ